MLLRKIALPLVLLVRSTTQQSSCPQCVCQEDSCLSALAGTSIFPFSATISDCRSFLWTKITVLSGTLTETVTVTDTANTGAPSITPANLKRQVGDMPVYAAPCSNSARYSSACGCLGIETGGTSYVHQAQVTVRVTVTVPNTGIPNTLGTTTVTVSTTTTITQPTTVTEPSTTTEVTTVIMSTTVTETTTATVSAAALSPDTSCGNAGLQVAIYPNPFNGGGGPYLNFDPTYYKTVAPYNKKNTTSIGFSTSESSNPYGLAPQDAGFYALNHRGYFYAPKTSVYTFSIIEIDDIGIFWMGPGALTGWTRANANGELTIPTNAGDPQRAPRDVTLQAGQYYPLRVIYANRANVGTMKFEISDASGIFYVQYGSPSSYLVTHSCGDTSAAPVYSEPFGAET